MSRNGSNAPSPQVVPPVEAAAVVFERGRRRVKLVVLLMGAAMFAVATRGVALGVTPDPQTLHRATDKRYAEVTTRGPRGDVFDADGNLLATSVQTPAVVADPDVLRRDDTDIDALSDRLSTLLKRPRRDIARKLRSPGRYVVLARDVHPAVAGEVRRLTISGRRVRGVQVREHFRRYYPQGELAAPLLGIVDARGRGVTGLESVFDDSLYGSVLVGQQRVDRFGNRLDVGMGDPRRVRGMSVHTTLDRFAQRAVERALAETLASHAPISAAAVVVEVGTGRVLALANAPSFDPNHVTSNDMPHTRNRAIGDAVEPGSVFKPFTVAAALDAGVATPQESLETRGPYRYGGIRDDHPHDRMTVSDVLKYSSNVGSAMLAERLGSSRLLAYFEDFGFGERSGIPLFGEAAGLRHPPGRVGPVELATISYGQGATSTTLQLAMAMEALANGGVRHRPLLVTRVVDAFGDERSSHEPSEVGRVVSEEAARAVRDALVRATADDGTGPRARVPGYVVGGKTGTAYKVKGGRYSPTARIASFVGFAPANRPELAIAVLVDEPSVGSRYGGVVAAPVFARIVADVLPHRGVLPAEDAPTADDDPSDTVAWTPQPVIVERDADAWRMPELHGRPMRDALASLQGLGVSFQVSGTGVLVEQIPSAGNPLEPGAHVELRFE